jgi:hypothetical protein
MRDRLGRLRFASKDGVGLSRVDSSGSVNTVFVIYLDELLKSNAVLVSRIFSP